MIKLTAEIIDEGKLCGAVKKDINSENTATALYALKDGMQALNFIDGEIKLIDKYELTFGQIWNEIQT